MDKPNKRLCATDARPHQPVHLVDKSSRPTVLSSGVAIDHPSRLARRMVVIRLIDYIKNM
ncbi:MAG: hypothetical protein ROW52_05655 [Anaerolineaceae bacterium]|jgi:hypothetical protein